MERFEVTIHDEWPYLKLVINGADSAGVTKSQYDTAQTNFEVHVRNALQKAVTKIIQRRKRSQL